MLLRQTHVTRVDSIQQAPKRTTNTRTRVWRLRRSFMAVDRSLKYIWRTSGKRVKKFAVVPRGTNKPK